MVESWEYPFDVIGLQDLVGCFPPCSEHLCPDGHLKVLLLLDFLRIFSLLWFIH